MEPSKQLGGHPLLHNILALLWSQVRSSQTLKLSEGCCLKTSQAALSSYTWRNQGLETQMPTPQLCSVALGVRVEARACFCGFIMPTINLTSVANSLKSGQPHQPPSVRGFPLISFKFSFFFPPQMLLWKICFWWEIWTCPASASMSTVP